MSNHSWWLSSKESPCRRHRKCRFNPWVVKIPWRRKWQPTPVFWPGESHGLYFPWAGKKSDTTEQISLSKLYQASTIYVLNQSVQLSCSIISESLPLHGLQHSRLPRPSPTPGACSNSSPLSWLCHPTISSSAVPFSYCLQSFPASGSFQISQFFASSGQSIGASASVSVLLITIQD